MVKQRVSGFKLIFIVVLLLVFATGCNFPVSPESTPADTISVQTGTSWSEGSASEAGIRQPVFVNPQAVHIIAVGDVMLGRMVNYRSIQKDDFYWPFRDVAGYLNAADLTLGNLEAPLVNGCEVQPEGMILCADPGAADGLVWAGFDMLSLANNHAYDHGQAGFDDTGAILNQAGIEPVYEQVTQSREIDGLRVGVAAMQDVSGPLDAESLVEMVAPLISQTDVTIVMMHWGLEYYAKPTWRQEYIGHALIDAGVDVIIGAHPHWIQSAEEYNGGLIFYSLGNFVFDQSWSEDTRKGLVLDLRIARLNGKDFIYTYDLLPVKIYDDGQPRFEEEE